MMSNRSRGRRSDGGGGGMFEKEVDVKTGSR